MIRQQTPSAAHHICLVGSENPRCCISGNGADLYIYQIQAMSYKQPKPIDQSAPGQTSGANIDVIAISNSTPCQLCSPADFQWRLALTVP